MPTRPRSVGDSGILLLVVISAGCEGLGPDRSLGAELFQTCALCHGPAGADNADIDAPAIAGLPVWYVAVQLKSFKTGMRGKHAGDLPGLRMRPMALTLGNELLHAPPLVFASDWYLLA